MLTIIDYGLGNLFSMQNAFAAIGIPVRVSREPKDILSASKLILPGVGAFRDGMDNLKRFNLVTLLTREVVHEKKPFLGICLGMQLLASVGEEHGISSGLGWIEGNVRRFHVDEKRFRVPHIGWNNVLPTGKATLFENGTDSVFYFAHSFHFVPKDESVISARCDYGEDFVAAVEQDNIFGIQFHPEKSQKCGLALLERFLAL
ncbi:MAG: imidazole glycerol phosphate synthase subunit HisH [bacterium]|nr:imidazole glycerol phosphate synthase subunit HisH [bacterium]